MKNLRDLCMADRVLVPAKLPGNRPRAFTNPSQGGLWIASSGLKGAMREKAERDWKNDAKVFAVFGPDTGQGEAAGALAVTDARILLLPVRSLQKVFLWVTCPMVIDRLLRDAGLAGITLSNVSADMQVSNNFALPPTGSYLRDHVVLEELRLNIDTDPGKQTQCKNLVTVLQSLAPGLTAAGLDGRLVLVGNEDFQYLCRHALQVSARIALNDKKTTTGGGGNLWYEETLPPETVMYALLLSNKPRYQGKSGRSGETSEGGSVGLATPPKNAQEVISAIRRLAAQSSSYRSRHHESALCEILFRGKRCE